MKQSAGFLNDHNILAIAEDLLAQSVDCFHERQVGIVEYNARICWGLLQRYNHLLQGNEPSDSEQGISKKQLLNQALERLQYFAKSLWRDLKQEAQEALWINWLKAGLVTTTDTSTHSAALEEVANA